MDQTKKLRYSDWLGASASGLCIIHCVLTPLIFTAKPVYYGMMGKQIHTHDLWPALDYIFLILSLLAVWYSARNTPHAILKWIFWVAWMIFALGLLFEPSSTVLGHWLMYIGSTTLVIAHIRNYFQVNQHCKIELSN